MLVACYAYEGMYQGLHGIESKAILNVSDNLKEAKDEINEWGREESEDLIYQYGLESEYCDEDEEDEEDDIFKDYDITNSIYYEDRSWYAHKIKETSLSEQELNDKLCQLGMELFVQEYCEKETLF